MSGPVEKARMAWGEDLPDWVRGLADACANTSQSHVAKQMNRSASLISAVLARKYKGSLEAVEEVYRGVFETATVSCPALGTIPTNVCRDWQLKARRFVSVNNLRVRMYRACHSCQRFKRKSND